jgi:hypothetical protein
MSFLGMMTSYPFIDILVKTVAGYCQNVQVLACIERRLDLLQLVGLLCNLCRFLWGYRHYRTSCSCSYGISRSSQTSKRVSVETRKMFSTS